MIAFCRYLAPLLLCLLSLLQASGFFTATTSRSCCQSLDNNNRIFPRQHLHSTYMSSVQRSDRSDVEQVKFDIMQLSAAMDRGQLYNPTSGEQ